MLMRLNKQNLVLVLLLVFSSNVYAGSASAKLSALANSLIKNYAIKAGVEKTTLAIFSLNCEEKLEKQRVGFAASEVMSHKFVSSGAFSVVERGELARLLSEQKLQASGAVDSETAVRLGKVLGARVILVGNIQKVGGKYQVNARLVNAETTEVITSGYEELDSSAFEEDASVYLNLVPDVQTLGIYAVYNYRKNSNKGAVRVESINPGVVNTLTPVPFTSNFPGGGLVYRPSKKIQINAEILVLSNGTVYSTGELDGRPISPKLKLTIASFMTSYVSRLGKKWGYLVGLGVQSVQVGSSHPVETLEAPPNGIFIRSGVEFKPQNRVGVGFNLKYDLRKIVAYSKYGSVGKVFELNPLSFESNITLYF